MSTFPHFTYAKVILNHKLNCDAAALRSLQPGAQAAHKLVIAGEAQYDEEAKASIEKLRIDFALPIEYRKFDKALGFL